MVQNLLLIILLFCAIVSVQADIANVSTIRNKKNVSPVSLNPPTSLPRTTTPVSVNNGNDSCNPFLAIMPDFSKPGRRISEVKCAEYIWQIWYRETATKMYGECREYRRAMAAKENRKWPMVLGGYRTKPGEFIHVGALGWNATSGTWIFKCGCSLISSKFVLTAAHCTMASDRDSTVADPVPKIVRLGAKNIRLEYDTLDVKISKMIVHPDYISPKIYNDIALIELDKEVIFTRFMQPACLWSNFDTSSLGNEATLCGWGVVEAGSRTTSPYLLAAEVDIIDSKQCDELLEPFCNRRWCGIRETQICAGKLSGGVDACQGDSGGPLQVEISLPVISQGRIYHVIGVTSFGIGCGRPDTPGIYTRVSSYIDWIDSIVWG